MELSDGSPMETSTPITPTCSARPHAADTLPTLSPKGGNVPDLKSASELPHGVKLESVQDSAGGSCGGGGVASSTDVVNNNSGLGGQDRKGSGMSEGQLSSGTPSSSVSSKTTAGSLDSSSGSNQNSMLSFTPSLQGRAPSTWSAQDVCLFLSVNDCGACSEVVLRRVRHLPVMLQQLYGMWEGGGRAYSKDGHHPHLCRLKGIVSKKRGVTRTVGPVQRRTRSIQCPDSWVGDIWVKQTHKTRTQSKSVHCSCYTFLLED